MNDDIVDTHGHQVNADSVMFAGHKGQFQFGADTVGGTHQNRPVTGGQIQGKQTAETADFTQNTALGGLAGDVPN